MGDKSGLMAVATKAIGKMTKCTELEDRYTQMETTTKAIGVMVKLMERGNTPATMVVFMKVFSWIMKSMGLVKRSGSLGVSL